MAELRPEYDAMGMDPGLYGDQLAYDANAMYSEAESAYTAGPFNSPQSTMTNPGMALANMARMAPLSDKQGFEVRGMTSEEASIVEEPWYYRTITRQEAEAMINFEPEGSFVVRPSKIASQFVLSIKTKAGFAHSIMRWSQSLQGWVLGDFRHAHASVHALIHHHYKHAIEFKDKPWTCLLVRVDRRQ